MVNNDQNVGSFLVVPTKWKGRLQKLPDRSPRSGITQTRSDTSFHTPRGENVLDPLQQLRLAALHREGGHFRVQLRPLLLQVVSADPSGEDGALFRLQGIARPIFKGNKRKPGVAGSKTHRHSFCWTASGGQEFKARDIGHVWRADARPEEGLPCRGIPGVSGHRVLKNIVCALFIRPSFFCSRLTTCTNSCVRMSLFSGPDWRRPRRRPVSCRSRLDATDLTRGRLFTLHFIASGRKKPYQGRGRGLLQTEARPQGPWGGARQAQAWKQASRSAATAASHSLPPPGWCTDIWKCEIFAL